jgi:hypothetical protein
MHASACDSRSHPWCVRVCLRECACRLHLWCVCVYVCMYVCVCTCIHIHLQTRTSQELSFLIGPKPQAFSTSLLHIRACTVSSPAHQHPQSFPFPHFLSATTPPLYRSPSQSQVKVPTISVSSMSFLKRFARAGATTEQRYRSPSGARTLSLWMCVSASV